MQEMHTETGHSLMVSENSQLLVNMKTILFLYMSTFYASLFKKKDSEDSERKESPAADGNDIEDFYCEKCNVSVNVKTLKKHFGSMQHMLSIGPNPSSSSSGRSSSGSSGIKNHSKSSFSIPSSNVGFKLLERKGWDGQSGLGKSAQGRISPVPVVVRQNRAGIGITTGSKPLETIGSISSSSKSKKDKDDVTLSKKDREEAAKKDRKWRQSFLRYMNEP